MSDTVSRLRLLVMGTTIDQVAGRDESFRSTRFERLSDPTNKLLHVHSLRTGLLMRPETGGLGLLWDQWFFTHQLDAASNNSEGSK